jgi:hypothetical protein
VTWQLSNGNVVAFHVVNVVAHVAVALLVLQFARKLGLSSEVSFWGALLFAVHPIHVESVTWVAGLKDPLFTALMLGAVLALLSYRLSLRPVTYGLCLLLMVAALLSKGIALATPVLFLATDRWLEPRPPWRLSVARAAGPAVIASMFLVHIVLILRITGVTSSPHGGSWGQNYLLMAWSLVRYAQQAFVPATFKLHYCFSPLDSFFDARLLGIAVALALVVGVLILLHGEKRVRLLVVWFLVCLAPVVNLVPHNAIMADRYLYAPSVAACIAIAWGMSRLTPGIRYVLLPACFIVFGAVTLFRGAVWQNEVNLWAEAAEDIACLRDDSMIAAVTLLNHAGGVEDRREAVEFYKKGLGHPSFHELWPEFRVGYLCKAVFAAAKLGDSALARKWSDQAIGTAPWLSDVWTSRAVTAESPAVVLDAAQRAFRLEQSAGNYWRLGFARLRVEQLSGLADIAFAVSLDRARYCEPFIAWLRKAPAQRQALLESVRLKCEHRPNGPDRRP